MSSIDEKLTKIIEGLAVVKTITSQHSQDLAEIQEKLEPVLFQINGAKWAARVIGGAVGLLVCLTGLLALLK